MDSRDTPESSTGGVGVRVLLPDGGQMEQPEEEGDAGDGEESSEEQTDAESQESESGEDDEQEAEGEDAESDEEQAEGEDEQAEEAAEDEAESEDEEEAEAGEGDEDESEEEAEAEGEEGEEAEEESEREQAVSDEGARLLHLNIDGLFLDLLGLEVDLDTVTLDLTAVEGDSKLLGNLLSAVSGLLGGDPLSSLLPDMPDMPGMPDNPLSGLLGGGEGDEEGEEGEEGEGSGLLPDVHPLQRAKELAGSIADAIRSAIDDAGSSIISALPLEELLAQFLQEVVNQILDSSDDGDEADAEEAAASA